MRRWLLVLGIVTLIGCSSPPSAPPPTFTPHPTPRDSYKPPAYTSYSSLAPTAETVVSQGFPGGDVECASEHIYYKLRVELITCIIYFPTQSVLMSAITTYGMETKKAIRTAHLAITPAQTGVYGNVVSCVIIYDRYDEFTQDCENTGRMLLSEYTNYVEAVILTKEAHLEAENNSLP